MQLAGKYKASLTVRLIFAQVVGTKGGHLNRSEIELLIFVAQLDYISLSSCKDTFANINHISSSMIYAENSFGQIEVLSFEWPVRICIGNHVLAQWWRPKQ